MTTPSAVTDAHDLADAHFISTLTQLNDETATGQDPSERYTNDLMNAIIAAASGNVDEETIVMILNDIMKTCADYEETPTRSLQTGTWSTCGDAGDDESSEYEPAFQVPPLAASRTSTCDRRVKEMDYAPDSLWPSILGSGFIMLKRRSENILWAKNVLAAAPILQAKSPRDIHRLTEARAPSAYRNPRRGPSIKYISSYLFSSHHPPSQLPLKHSCYWKS